MKKKLLIAFSSLLVLLGGGVFTGHAWLKSRLQKEQIIADMERSWNCRAQLDSTAVSFFRSPAKVELRGLKLALRDGEFLKPLSQRAPVDDAQALVSVNTAVLDVDLASLMSGRLDVKDLKLTGVRVRSVIDEEGDSSLDAMFDSPDSEAEAESHAAKEPSSEPKAEKSDSCDEKSAAAETPEEKPAKKPKKTKKQRVKKKHKPFKAGDLVVSLKVDEAQVEDADIEFLHPSEDSRVHLSNVKFTLKDIDVVATDLANHNACLLSYQGHILLDKPDAALKSADFDVSGDGNVAPFDRESGEWNPDLTINATLKKDGLLGGAKIADQLREKDMKQMKKYGIELGDIAAGGVLQEDASTDVHAFHGKLIVKQDTKLAFPDYKITLAKGSTISAAEDTITAKAVLEASPALSTNILDQAKKSSVENFGQSLADIGEAIVRKALVDDKGRLVLALKLKGKLSNPEVAIDTALDSAKDMGKSLLEGILKGGGK